MNTQATAQERATTEPADQVQMLLYAAASALLPYAAAAMLLLLFAQPA